MSDLNFAVVVRKLNEVSAHVDTEDFDFLCMLRDYFSFFADGYKFHPAFRNKQWDGKIRLLKNDDTIPLGLANDVKRFCERHNKQVFVDPQIKTHTLDKEFLKEFIETLNTHSGGDKIEPYYYQVDAVLHALEHQRCLLLSPTSSGKSNMIYMLVRFYQKFMPEKKILIIVPTVGLVTQMAADFDDYASEVDWKSSDYITNFSGGSMNDPDKPILLTTFQSLSNAKTKPDPEFFEQFEIIMNDEVHTAQSKSIKDILNYSVNGSIRVGLTGTLSESKTHEMVLRGMFGDIYNVISTHELMDMGAVAQLSVMCVLFKHTKDDAKFMRSAFRGALDGKGKQKKTKASYPEEIEHIISSEQRNKYLMRFTASLKGNSILMIKNIQHGENLYKWMTQVLPDRDIYLYNGATDDDTREEIRQLMETKENAIIIGSIGVLSTGISIKRLHNMVFAHPSKSRIKVLQTVGRILRKSKFGNSVNMFDFIDDFSIGAYENYTLEHGRIRTQFYHDQKFDTGTKMIQL